MSEVNGQFGGLKVQELLLDSGEYVYVQPLSIYVVRALQDKAEEKHPSPDKTEYEKPVDDDKALEPGLMIPAESNPDYQKAYDEAAEKRSQWTNDQAVLLCINPVEGQDTLIKKYKARVQQLRDLMPIPEDEWEATLKCCIMGSTDDYGRVITAIRGSGAPREDEIRDGMRIFRPLVRKTRPPRDDRQPEPSSPKAENETETQQPDGAIRSGAGVGVEVTKSAARPS